MSPVPHEGQAGAKVGVRSVAERGEHLDVRPQIEAATQGRLRAHADVGRQAWLEHAGGRAAR